MNRIVVRPGTFVVEHAPLGYADLSGGVSDALRQVDTTAYSVRVYNSKTGKAISGASVKVSFNAQIYSTTVQTTTLSYTITSIQVVQNIRTIVSTESSMNTTPPPFENIIL